MRKFLIPLAILAIAAGPTTNPAVPATSQPSALDPYSAVIAARASEKHAVEVALSRLRLTEQYKREKAELEACRKALDDARQIGSPQDKLDASHNFVVADQNLKKMEAATIAADPLAVEAQQNLKQALAAVESLDRKNQTDREEAARRERERLENDPIQRGLREGRIVMGMSEVQAQAAFTARKIRNREGGGGDGSAVGVQGRAGIISSIPPTEDLRKSTDELRDGVKDVTFDRILRYPSGQEVVIDEVRVTLENGKVVEIFGQ